MKKTLMLIGVMVSFVAVSVAASAGPRGKIRRTQRRQVVRIADGVKSGELNKPEARRLVRQQARIGKMRKKAAEDGKLTLGEAARIRHQQKKANRRIYRQKHDGQKRNSDSAE